MESHEDVVIINQRRGTDLHITDKEKKHAVLIHDQLQICNWAAAEFGWPCSHKENYFDYLRTFKAFQRAYNENNFAENPSGTVIDVDGDWGPDTWGAMFDCYELKFSNRLMIPRENLATYRTESNITGRFMFPGKPYTGCGEYHPIESPNLDNYYSKTNRRAEIFFFPPDKPAVIACSSGECNGKGCTFYEPMLQLRGKKMEARWSEGLTFAAHRETRDMTLSSPELNAGDKVTFEPYQLHNGKLTKLSPAVVEVNAGNGSASTTFNELCEKIVAFYPADTSSSDLSYFFLARHENFTALSARLHAASDSGLHI
ncbi:MAG: hypothetical protein JW863_17490 [Chitinispirillaceae bacterium]|nr:hypothetical protein [Chitinispirillaceae bacterium]